MHVCRSIAGEDVRHTDIDKIMQNDAETNASNDLVGILPVDLICNSGVPVFAEEVGRDADHVLEHSQIEHPSVK